MAVWVHPAIFRTHAQSNRTVAPPKCQKSGQKLLELGENSGSPVWLRADVIGYNAITGTHQVEYNDGDNEDLDLLRAERDWAVTKLVC
jgi:predicted metal-dependent HD superfamily phosphohydrolase